MIDPERFVLACIAEAQDIGDGIALAALLATEFEGNHEPVVDAVCSLLISCRGVELFDAVGREMISA